MKRNKLTTLAALFVAVATLTATTHALTTIQVQGLKAEVLSVPVPEMPAKAADLVKRALKKDRQAVALTAVRAIVDKHRAAAPLVISAISKVAPDLAATVAAAGAEIAPDHAPSIASAAVAAAPAHAEVIQSMVVKAAPAQAPTVIANVTRATETVRATTPPVATATPAANAATASRGSAHEHPATGGTITVSDTTIAGGNFPFNSNPPRAASDPRVIYNQPPQ